VIKAVVKHSYVKGRQGIGKARAHINYLQYRPGEDREKGARSFFDKNRDEVLGREIKERLREQDQRGATMHKIILSPGINTVDMERYTREVMEQIERQKGLNLEYYAIQHRNTDHHHVHVVVMGKDLDGRNVKFDREDHKRLRQYGDRYLEREHQLDRYLDRELEFLLKRPDRSPEIEYKRQRGDAEYERLLYGDGRDRRRPRDAERDRRDWEQLDRDLHKAFEPSRGPADRMTYSRFQRESAGRMQDYHFDYQNQQARNRWELLASRQPELALQAQGELAWLEQLEREQKMDRFGRSDIDQLIDGKDDYQRFVDHAAGAAELGPERVERERPVDEPSRGVDVMDMFTGKYFEHDWKPERDIGEQSVVDTIHTVAQDLESDERGRKRDDREEKERERGDDVFGR
jgi:hypothetical protein